MISLQLIRNIVLIVYSQEKKKIIQQLYFQSNVYLERRSFIYLLTFIDIMLQFTAISIVNICICMYIYKSIYIYILCIIYKYVLCRYLTYMYIHVPICIPFVFRRIREKNNTNYKQQY